LKKGHRRRRVSDGQGSERKGGYARKKTDWGIGRILKKEKRGCSTRRRTAGKREVSGKGATPEKQKIKKRGGSEKKGAEKGIIPTHHTWKLSTLEKSSWEVRKERERTGAERWIRGGCNCRSGKKLFQGGGSDVGSSGRGGEEHKKGNYKKSGFDYGRQGVMRQLIKEII